MGGAGFTEMMGFAGAGASGMKGPGCLEAMGGAGFTEMSGAAIAVVTEGSTKDAVRIRALDR